MIQNKINQIWQHWQSNSFLGFNASLVLTHFWPFRCMSESGYIRTVMWPFRRNGVVKSGRSTVLGLFYVRVRKVSIPVHQCLVHTHFLCWPVGAATHICCRQQSEGQTLVKDASATKQCSRCCWHRQGDGQETLRALRETLAIHGG